MVLTSSSSEKLSRLKGLLGRKLAGLFNVTATSFFQSRGKDTCSGLVFCPNVNGSFGVVQVRHEVTRELEVPADYYSGAEPKNVDPKKHRKHKRLAASAFKRNRIPLLVCTKAFGMGIDKPNIRYTIHYGIPDSIESFYQEAGRAGRDRKPAWCCLIVSNDDPQRSSSLLAPHTPIEEIVKVVKNERWADKDDITRMLWFHIESFRGIEREMQEVEKVLSALGDIGRRATQSFCLRGSDRTAVEKALHRLSLIGLVTDYTIQYAAEEFTVRLSGSSKEQMIETYGEYVAGYLESLRQNEIRKARQFANLPLSDFVKSMADLAIRFVYDVIEKGRRRALQEMLLACTDTPTDEGLRARILRYLESTEYSEALDRLIADSHAGMAMLRDTFAGIRSPNDAAELRGQVTRYLESYPDHPGLLMLRALSEAYTREPNVEIVRQNLGASVALGREKYNVTDKDLWPVAAWAIGAVATRHMDTARTLIQDILEGFPNRATARALVEHVPIPLKSYPARFLLNQIQERCQPLMAGTGEENGH